VEGSNVGRIPSRIVTGPVSVDPCPNPVDHSSAESAANVSCVPSTASLGPRKQLVPGVQPGASPLSPQRPGLDTAVIQFDTIEDGILQNSILKKKEKDKSSLHK